jgi:Fe-S-cluster-containing hydrogenase component 2
VLSRRTFLRGTGLAVVAVGPAVGAACHVRRFVDDPAFARAAIVGDSALCVGCRRCEITCSALHHPGRVWPEMALLSVDARAEERRFMDGLWFADACHECPYALSPSGEDEPPACMAACPRDAIRVGRVGEGPVGDLRLRVVDPETERVAICDLCVGRDEGPACVEACPSTALRYYEPWRRLPERPFPWEG